MLMHTYYCDEWFCPKFKLNSNAFEIWFRNGFEKKILPPPLLARAAQSSPLFLGQKAWPALPTPMAYSRPTGLPGS